MPDTYDPSEVGKKGSIFGLPYKLEESDVVLLPVHLDVTVSYNEGTALAPGLILDESSQLDVSLRSIDEPWKLKMAMHDQIVTADQNKIHRARAIQIIDTLEAGGTPDEEQLSIVNVFCKAIHKEIESLACGWLEQGKIVGVVGGDHSSPLGLMKALARTTDFGILQIDAHMDLRDAYEGFDYSHASIMRNALCQKGITSLTQVGIRDFCDEEEQFVKNGGKPIYVFYDEDIYRQSLGGVSWKETVSQIVETLPKNVYLSFDMDGLDPTLCPHTGTPVPGGLGFNEAAYLIEEVVRSGRKIIGFDVCETGNNPWDANVAARIIYRIATLAGVSHNLLRFR